MATEVKGLKKLRNPGGAAKRQGNWGNPNAKSAARAAIRNAAYDRAGLTPDKGYNRPGSLNVKNQH